MKPKKEGYTTIYVRPSTKKRLKDQANKKGIKMMDYLEELAKINI